MVEYLRVFRHVGFFLYSVTLSRMDPLRTNTMDKTELTMVQQLAEAARPFQLQQTGRAPTDVSASWAIRAV